MSIDTPRVPAAYAAIDSAAFTVTEGPAFDAFLLDTMGQAHNRLQAVPGHGFALAVPESTVTYGDASEAMFRTVTGAGWQLLVPELTWPSKPGATTASFRGEVNLSISGEYCEFQLVTEASPFELSPDRTAPNYVSLKGDGTAAQTLSFDDVPISAAELSRCALWVRSASRGNAIGTGYGTPTSGTVVHADYATGIITCRDSTLSNSVSWNTSGGGSDTFASKGYGLELTGPDSSAVTLLITRVDLNPQVVPGVGTQGDLTVFGLSRQLTNQLVSRFEAFTWEIRELPSVALFGWSGATEARTQ